MREDGSSLGTAGIVLCIDLKVHTTCTLPDLTILVGCESPMAEGIGIWRRRKGDALPLSREYLTGLRQGTYYPKVLLTYGLRSNRQLDRLHLRYFRQLGFLEAKAAPPAASNGPQPADLSALGVLSHRYFRQHNDGRPFRVPTVEYFRYLAA